jgi:hypothetical protein
MIGLSQYRLYGSSSSISLIKAKSSCTSPESKSDHQYIAFFRGGNKLDSSKICDEIVGIAPAAQRYDILELCLYVAQSKGSVTAEELNLLKNTWQMVTGGNG